MSQLEINSKKIETLTKVARLLGDQLKAQGEVISKLQNEIDWIKDNLKENSTKSDSLAQKSATVINEAPEASSVIDQSEHISIPDTSKIISQKPKKEPKSEKEELLEALSIIDNL